MVLTDIQHNTYNKVKKKKEGLEKNSQGWKIKKIKVSSIQRFKYSINIHRLAHVN